MTLSAAALAIAVASSAEAATYTVYTDRAAFLAAAGQVASEDFNSGNPENFFFRESSVDIGDFRLTDVRSPQTGLFSKIGATPVGGQTIDGTRFVETFGVSGGAQDAGLVLTFDNALRAFGANFASGGSNNVQLRIGGESFFKTNFSLGGFFGVVADGDFNDVLITAPINTGTIVAFDNVLYGSGAAAVPEPASWAMMIAGFGIAGATARSRRARARVLA
ncbi:PEPxxWA-CTERM sorting domain-containing protein [Sphingomonas sp. ID1715]|uniref:PEPxxWA-CTERM sorting domain-containing protein n=1 Tax=Sphingomonas sp. ID1715 TaxID=1656898 RepID=UPI00148962EB|nr:PEPxxWA-CTERM sorting domain-containing protein [Sphingomonas sp. ID1715]NNM78035.1 PEPxxWA-CTERM sorting domain-containing protein [Sphingomonas sp. ID1715]